MTRPVTTLAAPTTARSKTTSYVCSYTWTAPNRTADLTALKRLPGATVEPDPPIVVPTADPERDSKWFEPLHELTRARLAIPRVRPPHPTPNGVRVVVLDTAADTATGYIDPVGHGRAVTRVIEELACGELEDCATQIRQISALPFVSDPNTSTLSLASIGGIGTRGVLAAAIDSATSEWAATPQDLRPRNLILNLSLGWSGCWEIDAMAQSNLDSLWTAPRDVGSEAVLQAIGRAVCRGALVVAASGNGEPDATCPTDPPAPGEPRYMFPGLWGGARVDRDVCSRLGVPATFDEPRPLLIGVGAVDQNDRRLSVAANDADWVAYGQYLTVRDSTQSSGWTLSLSGTSMSAAALSGVAAGVWSYRPDLTIPQLLAAIGDTSVVLGPPDPNAAEFLCNQQWNGATCRDVRRISLCNALSKVVSGLDCTTPGAATETPVSFQTMSPVAPAGAAIAVDCATCGSSCPAACEFSISEIESQNGPWIVPQPKPPGCGTCVMVPLLPLFQAEFLYPVGSVVLIVRHLLGYEVRVALQDSTVPALIPTSWLLPLSTLGGVSARLVYRASSSLAKESGDVVISSVPPFTVPCGLLEPCP